MRKVEYHFWTIDKFREEEKWLNEKAQQGWALVDAFAVRYVFVPCEPGEYTYKIMYTEEMPSAEARKEFEAFMAESGIETVGKYHRWGYYRKKNDGIPFELFNTQQEELNHVNRIKRLATLILALMILNMFTQTMAFINNHAMFPVFVIMLCMLIFVGKIYLSLSRTAKELEKDIGLFE